MRTPGLITFLALVLTGTAITRAADEQSAQPAAPASPSDARAPARPNILLIVADDMGYSDLSCFGGEIQTPNLDALASNGVRFTQFYSTARCCPSRASILTGQYPHRVGIGHMVTDLGHPGYRGRLS